MKHKYADGGMSKGAVKKVAKEEVQKHVSKMHKGVPKGRAGFADGGMAGCASGMSGTGRRSMQDYGK